MEASDEQGAAILAAPSNGNGNGAGRRLTVEDFTPATPIVETEEVVVGDRTVLVRGFIKSVQREVQQMALGEDGEVDEDKLNIALLWKGMVEPQLTFEQAEQAFRTWPAGQLDAIVVAIMRVSGMLPGFVREAVATFREDAGDGVRVPAGAGAGDDGGPSEGADVGA